MILDTALESFLSKARKTTSSTPCDFKFNKYCTDVNNDTFILAVLHSNTLKGCLPNDYSIQLKSNANCVAALLKRVLSEGQI